MDPLARSYKPNSNYIWIKEISCRKINSDFNVHHTTSFSTTIPFSSQSHSQIRQARLLSKLGALCITKKLTIIAFGLWI